MKNSVLIFLIILLMTEGVVAQRTKPADADELSAITNRGRMLADYDAAAWRSTDAVLALKPQPGEFTGYVAMKTDKGWTVGFGRLTDKKDKFLIVFEAVQQGTTDEYRARKLETAKEDSGFFRNAARALETAVNGFTPVVSRPYNAAVLPAADGKFFVYLVPAQTEHGIFPLGGDTRFLLSPDGSKVLETRQLHRSIIEFQVPKDVKPKSGYHTAILDDVPEDTDVFHVLAREPKVPELVVTQKFVYLIEVDGSIRYLMTVDAFKKIGNKQ